MLKSIEEIRNLRKIIGENIYRRRMERKMTLRKMSRLTGIRMEKLDQYEIGKNEICLEELFLIARPLEISMEKLLIPEPKAVNF